MCLVRQYAQWEEAQKDFRRARSVWERAMDVNYTSVTLWLKYAEMEMRHRFINHARNVWDRAVRSELALKAESVRHRFPWSRRQCRSQWLANIRGGTAECRDNLCYRASCSLLPRVDQLWYKYIHMEEMLGNVAGARQIFERWMAWEPDHHGWAAYIKARETSRQWRTAMRA